MLVDGRDDWGRPLVIGLLIAALLRGLLGAFQLRVLRRLQHRLAVAHTSRFVWHLLRLPASYYAQRGPGDVSSRIALNDQVAEVLSGRLATTTIDVVVMIVYALVMWQASPRLTLVALGFAVANVGILTWTARTRQEDNARLAVEHGKFAGAGIAGLQSIRTLKASALESDFFARWSGFLANLSNAHQERHVLNYYIGVVPPLLVSLLSAAVLVAGGLEVINGRMRHSIPGRETGPFRR